MGRLYQIWDQFYDPTDAINPYTPYTFKDAQMSMDLALARRESVMTVPGLDGALDQYGSTAAPFDKRYFAWSFRVVTKGGPDAAHDLLMQQLAPDQPVRLVYITDSGDFWFNLGHFVSTEETFTIDQNWYFDFRVKWRIRSDWRKQTSEAAQVFRPATLFVHLSTFASLGVTVVNTNPKNFTIDATGIAGRTLPTIPDTGPTITLTGPLGGSGQFAGVLVANIHAPVRDEAGSVQATQFLVPFQIPTANDSVTLRFASRSFTRSGPSFPGGGGPLSGTTRLVKANYQPWYFKITPGKVNSCSVTGQGTSPLTGGRIKVDWWRKRA
jgi:hypothetical protein